MESVKDLGVTFNMDLRFNDHIVNITSRATRMAGFILRNCSEFRNTQVLKRLYVALVRPLVEYNTIVWSPSTACTINMLEGIQRKFLKYIHLKNTGSYPVRGYPNHLLLEEFQLYALERRRTYFEVVFILKVATGKIDSTEILERLKFRVPRASARIQDIFYVDHSRKCVKWDASISRMCRSINEISRTIDLATTTVGDLRNVYFQ